MSDLTDLEVSRAFPAREIRVAHDDGALILRPTLMSDAAQISAAVEASVNELKAYMPWAHFPQTARTQLERLRGVEAAYYAGEDLVMGLFRASDGVLLTMVGLHPRVALNPAALEVGYWAPTPHAGRGWTTLGVKVAMIYAFDKLGADRVQVTCDERNAPSRKVIERCGFVFEGIVRNIISAPSAELVAGGYQGSGRSASFALVPPELAALPWVSDVRERMRYVNLGGHELAPG